MRVAAMPLPVPLYDEHVGIPRCAQRIDALAHAVLQTIGGVSSRVNRSSQSILAKAFRGELFLELADKSTAAGG